MNLESSLETLSRRRTELWRHLNALGDFRQGALASQYRKCGKPGCHCAEDGDVGHGPRWVVTRSVDRKTRSQSIPAAAVEATQAQVAEYHRFRALTRELTEVSSRICEERLKHGEPEIPEKKGRWSKRSKRKSARS